MSIFKGILQRYALLFQNKLIQLGIHVTNILVTPQPIIPGLALHSIVLLRKTCRASDRVHNRKIRDEFFG